MIVKVKYFDIEKYEDEWKQYYKDEQTIHSNRLLSPTDKGVSPYFKDIEIKTDKFIIYDSLTTESHRDGHGTVFKKPRVFDYIIEIDNDYLYHDHKKIKLEEDIYYSHANGLRVMNEYYKKYGNPNLIDFSSSVFDGHIFGKIERDLKLESLLKI